METAKELIARGEFLAATKHLYADKCVLGVNGHDLAENHEGNIWKLIIWTKLQIS